MAWYNATGGPDALRYGYTLTDLHRIARLATHTDRSHHAGDYLDRLNLAFSGAAEYLYSAEHPPAEHELVRAARDAVQSDAQSDLKNRMVSHHTYEPMRNAARYWELHRVSHSHENVVVDRTALWQIWPRLRKADQAALLALAAHGDYAAAAESMGMQYRTFCMAVYRARLRFFRLWHEGEKPSGMWGKDKRAGNGGKLAVNPKTATQRIGVRRSTKARAARSAA